MSRPDLSRVPKPFHGYINQVKENDLGSAFQNQTASFIQFMKELPAAKRSYRYAEGKWSVQEMFQHIIDAERVFTYRALCFARKDATSLPSFDENDYADNSKADQRSWDEMMEEFSSLRRSTEILFRSMDNDQLETNGTTNGNSIYVLALGYIVVGHVTHHLNIIKERYL